jgi:hypothetical protein
LYRRVVPSFVRVARCERCAADKSHRCQTGDLIAAPRDRHNPRHVVF